MNRKVCEDDTVMEQYSNELDAVMFCPWQYLSNCSCDMGIFVVDRIEFLFDLSPKRRMAVFPTFRRDLVKLVNVSYTLTDWLCFL